MNVEAILGIINRAVPNKQIVLTTQPGGGLAWLAYISRLDVDGDVEETADGDTPLEAVIELAHKLGLSAAATPGYHYAGDGRGNRKIMLDGKHIPFATVADEHNGVVWVLNEKNGETTIHRGKVEAVML